jgi:hypothetical protein
MKKLVLWALVIVVISVSDMLPFAGTDVAKLHPIEVLIVQRNNDILSISTDSGITGFGEDVPQALSDIKLVAAGEVFLETANYVLLSPDCSDVIDSFFAYIRPACQIYLFEGEGDWYQVSKYLESHPSNATLLACKRGEAYVPKIIVQEGEFRLAEQ